jgi:glycosyltransferase involved in cell wall biosynthesis
MALPFVDGSSTRRGTLQTAWAFGLPVVTTPPGTPQETAIQTGINCVTVPLDAEQWAEAITRVLESETTAKRLAYGSRQAGEHHNWERLATEHLRRYDMALSQESRCG